LNTEFFATINGSVVFDSSAIGNVHLILPSCVKSPEISVSDVIVVRSKVGEFDKKDDFATSSPPKDVDAFAQQSIPGTGFPGSVKENKTPSTSFEPTVIPPTIKIPIIRNANDVFGLNFSLVLIFKLSYSQSNPK
jgi:hypothetical protein